jgi:hypothetical protein
MAAAATRTIWTLGRAVSGAGSPERVESTRPVVEAFPIRHLAAGRQSAYHRAPMAKHSSHILELAKKGAEARFRELADEASLLINSFPHLRDAFNKDQLPISFILRRDADRRKAKAGRRRKMSAAARKAVSERMTKYWAARRRAKA